MKLYNVLLVPFIDNIMELNLCELFRVRPGGGLQYERGFSTMTIAAQCHTMQKQNIYKCSYLSPIDIW